MSGNDSCTKEITLQGSGSYISGRAITFIRVEIDICLWFVSGRNLTLLIFILLWVQEPPPTSSSSSQCMQMSRFMQVRLQSSLRMRHVRDTEENMENHMADLSKAIQKLWQQWDAWTAKIAHYKMTEHSRWNCYIEDIPYNKIFYNSRIISSTMLSDKHE